MKRLLTCLCFLMFVFATSCVDEDYVDWEFHLDRNKKTPYGTYIAFRQLKDIFPYAKVEPTNNLLKQIRNVNTKSNEPNSVAISINDQFSLNDEELTELINYIHNGNSACIMANAFSPNLLKLFELESSTGWVPADSADAKEIDTQVKDTTHKDTSLIDLKQEDLQEVIAKMMTYDTVKVSKYISLLFEDTLRSFEYKTNLELNYFKDTVVTHAFNLKPIGWIDSSKQKPNVYKYDSSGVLILSHAPVTFTNHFLLQNSNKAYYEYLLSQFSFYWEKIHWSSKLRHIPQDDEDDNSLTKFPPLFKAFMVVLFLLLVYTLFEAKRRQRIVPVQATKENTSLEFVETVGRLYFNKKDHANLAQKMITHYLDILRTKHHLKTQNLDVEFVKTLAHKVNQSETDVQAFVSYLNYIRQQEKLSEIDIQHLNLQLKKFV